MLFRFRRMRAAADFLAEGGAGVRPFGMSDGPGAGGGSAGLPSGMQAMSRADGDAGRGENRPMGASGGGAARPAGRRFGGDDEEPDSDLDGASEVVEKAQQNEDSGVEEDMATLVLDNAALGVRPGIAGAGPGTGPELPNAGAAAADPNSDAAIMLRVAAGDEAGFNYLVQKYHRAMINFLYRMVHNQSVAEELAQEVFLRVYRSRESYRAEAKFTTWLYRIATNLAVNNARDTKHERAAQNVYLDVPDEETGTTPEVADDRPSVEQSLLKDERMAAIRKHVMALPERQRTAVLMHKYQGLDYRQIGEVLKLSESATKSLLFRAYQTLREKLKEFV
jgi:RNA polymerase sigma-70 factor (ECF subfamily)